MVVAEKDAEASAEPVALDRVVARARALRPWVKGLIAYLIYQVLTIVLWAAPVFGDPAHRILGIGLGDSRFYEWALRWTPWALTHGRNPIFTDRIFAPTGVNLAWTTFIPGPAALMSPITAAFGPLVSYNVLMALAPALAAWATYLVCIRVTRAFWPSLVGGYLFGFSTYMVGQMHGHVNLVLIFPVPLAVYLVVRRIEGSLTLTAFVGWLALTLLGLFSIMPETFATATLFGVLAFGCAIVAAGNDRARVFRVGLEVALAYAIVAVVLLPFVISAVRHLPSKHLRPTDRTSIDLLSPIVPRPVTVFGSRIPLLRITDKFSAGAAEDAGYIGLGLALLFVLFAVTERRRRGTWGLVGFVLLATAISLGPVIHLVGRTLGPGPDVIVTHTPLLLNATSQRFPVYTSLALGVIAALWLARARGRWAWLRWGVVVVAVAVLLPRVPSPPFYPTESLPSFITDGTYRQVLQPDETVFPIVPTLGDELRWQQAADFYYRLPAAYIGALPDRLRHERLYRALAIQQQNPYMPNPKELADWLGKTGVTSVVLDDTARVRFEPLLLATGLQPVFAGGGVSVWREPPGGAVPRIPPVVTVMGKQDWPGGYVSEFQVPALEGGPHYTWSQYAGQPLLMSFYTETCDCDAHLRAMQEFQEAHPDVGALAIDSFTGTRHPRDVVADLGLTYDVGIDELGRIAQSFDHPSSLPFTVMLRADGRVLTFADGTLDAAGFESLYRAGVIQASMPVRSWRFGA